MSLVSTWLHGIGLANAEIIDAFQKAGIVEPESLALVEMNQYASLGVVEATDRKKLFYLVQRVKIAVEESVTRANRLNENGDDDDDDDERQKQQCQKVRPHNKSNSGRKHHSHTASSSSTRYSETSSSKAATTLSKETNNSNGEINEEIDADSELAGTVAASSSHSNPIRRNTIDSLDTASHGLRLLKRQSSDSRLHSSTEVRRIGSEPSTRSKNIRSSRPSERIRGRSRGHSTSTTKIEFEEDIDSSTSKNNSSTKTLSGPLVPTETSTSNRSSAVAASARRRTIHVFSSNESANDDFTSPLMTPDSTESSPFSKYTAKSHPPIRNEIESSKIKYRSKHEKKLSSIPAGVPAIMSPLQDKSNSSTSSIDSSTNNPNSSTKSLSGPVVEIRTSNRSSAAVASARRRTIHVFPPNESDDFTSPLTTPDSTESVPSSKYTAKSHPPMRNEIESSKIRYRSKIEKKLSSIPAGVPAVMSPLQDKSNSPTSSSCSDVITEEENVNQENNVNSKSHGNRGRSLPSQSNRRASASNNKKPPQKLHPKDEAADYSKAGNRLSNSLSRNNSKQVDGYHSNSTRALQKKEQHTIDTAPAVFIHGVPEDDSWGAQVAALREVKNREFASIHPYELEDEEDMRIRVVVRKRPMSKREAAANEVDIIHPFDCNGRLFVYQPKTRVDLTKEIDTSAFAYDNVFEYDATNSAIYDTCIKRLIPGVFEGRWVSVFAYGQTGSGKSFTMLGSNLTGMKAGNSKEDRANLGVYFLAAQDVFKYASDSKNSHLSISVSLFEIYGGKLLDLLNNRAQVKCLEDHKGKVCFPGLSEHGVKSPGHIMQIIEAGAANRSMGSTSANADSSRSHAVLQLSLRKRVGKKANVEHGRLSFIDLAGSERGADTNQASRATRLEGAEINTSLLALKEVIRALAVGGTMQHIPFRGSKLTQVLKESFVGKKSRTVMISCVAPNLSNCEHTLNTLRYADRVKERNPDTGKPAVGNSNRNVSQEEKKAPVSKTTDSDLPVFISDPVEVSSDKSYFDDFSSCETIDGCIEEGHDQHNDDAQFITEEECIQDVINGELRKVCSSLIATHSTSMADMLNLVQNEASLVHTAGTHQGKIKEYLDGLEKYQAQKLAIISNLRDSLFKFNEARDLIYSEAAVYSNSLNQGALESEILYSEDEFEDLRD